MTANPNSILDSTKKVLGISDTDTSFDLDVVMHINSALAELAQLGVGADTGFVITDNSTLWSQYVSQLAYLPMVQQFIYMSVRLAFDPPANSWTMAAVQAQIQKLSSRINIASEHFNPPSDPFGNSQFETVIPGLSDLTQEEIFYLFGDGEPMAVTIFRVKAVNLSFASVVSPDATQGNTFYLTMTGDCTINPPTGGIDGQHVTLEIISNGHTVTWGNGWNFGAAGVPSLSSGGLTDIISGIFNESATQWRAGFTAGF